jgi:hypothetical protein
MRRYNMKLQPDECEFMRKEVSYLGHVIGQNGVRPDEKRIDAVQLGLAGYYRRYIPNFSKTAKPLTELVKKNKPYIWDDKTERAFVTLKTTLTTEPLLQYPDFTRPFVLTTDASNDANGAVLSQGPMGRDARLVTQVER